MGVAVLGDSVSAHFSIPEQWVGKFRKKSSHLKKYLRVKYLDAYRINSAVFQHLAFIVENEADWPQISAITGIK